MSDSGSFFRRVPLSVVVFGAVFLTLWLMHSDRLDLRTDDEGIYLDAADRMAQGQKLYVDF